VNRYGKGFTARERLPIRVVLKSAEKLPLRTCPQGTTAVPFQNIGSFAA
jgi:hypothetical protein